MRYMHRNRALQNQLMFVFSAHNLTQMYRRMRFTREYAQYQRAQGEAVMLMKEQVALANEELNNTKRQKSNLLSRGEQERRNLENKQTEQQQVVNSLQSGFGMSYAELLDRYEHGVQDGSLQPDPLHPVTCTAKTRAEDADSNLGRKDEVDPSNPGWQMQAWIDIERQRYRI